MSSNPWIKEIEVRWADLDPNFHLRHSVYYDYGATMRVDFLYAYNITAEFMRAHSLGPVILREECVFLKEIASGNKVTVDISLVKARPDYSRWTILHKIFKNGDTLAANLTIDGGWLNLRTRRLCVPPQEVFEAFKVIPTTENFHWEEKII